MDPRRLLLLLRSDNAECQAEKTKTTRNAQPMVQKESQTQRKPTTGSEFHPLVIAATATATAEMIQPGINQWRFRKNSLP